jgi:hypothetical protein
MNGYAAPLGKNLETACQSWKACDEARQARERAAEHDRRCEAARDDVLRQFEETGEW